VPVPTGTRPGVTSPGRTGHASPRVCQSIGVNVWGSVNELTDGTVCSVDAAMKGSMAPYWEPRFRRVCL
jgi:hypothetical protein